jgi:hypothetical protein
MEMDGLVSKSLLQPGRLASKKLACIADDTGADFLRGKKRNKLLGFPQHGMPERSQFRWIGRGARKG